MRLNGVVDDAQRRAGRRHLDHGDLQLRPLVAHLVHGVGGLETQQAGHLDVHARLGDALLPHRLLGDALAEGGAGEQPLAHLLQRHLGRAERPHAVVDAARAQPPLRDLEAAALAQQQVVGRHAHVAQDDFGVAVGRVVIAEHRQHPHHLDARRIQRHQDLRLLLVARRVWVALAHDDGDLAARVAHARRPPLAPVDDVLVALAPDGSCDVGGVGGGDLRLGHQEGGADFALHQRLQPAGLLRVGAVEVQHLHVAGVGRGAVEHFGGVLGAPHLLGAQGVVQVGQARAAVVAHVVAGRRRHEQVPQPLRLGLGLQRLQALQHDPAVGAGGLVLVVHAFQGGIDLRIHEVAYALEPVALRGGQGEVQGGAPDRAALVGAVDGHHTTKRKG